MIFLTNIDLTKNELQNAVIQNLATPPSSPATGQIYVDTSGTPVLSYWDGTEWISIGTGSGTLTSISAGDATITIGGTDTDPTVAVATAGITNTQISASAGIAYSKIATPVAAVSFGSQVLNNVATPSSSTDAATKGYVDSTVQGLNPKAAAIAASTANVTISSAPSTLDSISLAASNRVLLKDQTTTHENGIYVFTSTGTALTRSTDMDSWSEVPGAYLWVEQGTVNSDTAYVCTSNVGGTLETTAIVWSKFANAATLGATTPLVISSNTISLNLSTRIVLNGSNIDLQAGVTTPGTFSSVTVDTYGRVTAGTDIITSNGLVARTATGTFAARTITGTTNQIDVTNGNGVSGNPTISLDSNARGSINATGFYSALGSSTGTSFTISQATHGLGSTGNSYCDLHCQAYDVSSNPAVLVFTDVSINTSTGAVTFSFAASVTLTNYRFTIIGK
jgi:hypothetical protein